MKQSPRLKWPVPDNHTDPWYEAFVSYSDAQDASGYASREDRSLILFGGGTPVYNAGNISWDEDIVIVSTIANFLLTIPSGDIDILDSYVLYVDLVRFPTQSVTLTAKVAPSLPNTDEAFALAVRIGNSVYWRPGLFGVTSGSGSNEIEVRSFLYTATGSEGVEFDIVHNLAISNSYSVVWEPEGVALIPFLDIPNAGGDRTPNKIKVLTTASLTAGDKLRFLFFVDGASTSAERLTGSGVISTSIPNTFIAGSSLSMTLANSTVDTLQKNIIHTAGTTVTVTVANASWGTTITFGAAPNSAKIIWDNTAGKWHVVSLYNAIVG